MLAEILLSSAIALAAVVMTAVAYRINRLYTQRVPDMPSSTAQATVNEKKRQLLEEKGIPIISVNYHFTRECNYSCGFCFHTKKNSYIASIEDAKKGLKKLADLGMRKLNLSGGEPFLHERFVGEICRFAKTELNLESASIVSNGSKIREAFFRKYGEFVDILAISVDSFNEETNVKIGRGKGDHLQHLMKIARWCEKYHVMFKINSVINRYNVQEDFSEHIVALCPFRWKVFQVLPVDTENMGDGALTDVSRFEITAQQFEDFCRRHEHLQCFVKESNSMMRSSYIIIDEYMRFIINSKITPKSILDDDADIPGLLASTKYKHKKFVDRGGIYDWTRERNPDCQLPGELEW